MIFDVGPSLGSINRAVLIATDFFVSPMSIDIFSVKAIQNISTWLSKWRKQWRAAWSNLDDLEEVDSDLQRDIEFAGYVSQQYIAKRDSSGSKRAVNAYDRIMSQFDKVIRTELTDNSNPNHSSINFDLGSIPNLHSLIPMSQTNRAPVFGLKAADGVRGAHFSKVKDAKDTFGNVSNNILSRIRGKR